MQSRQKSYEFAHICHYCPIIQCCRQEAEFVKIGENGTQIQQKHDAEF